MAINDGVTQMMGTAEIDRQPAAGVEEHLSALGANGTTNDLAWFNGTTAINIIVGTADITVSVGQWRNVALMITNAIYFRKVGTTDICVINGVQTNV